MRIFWGFFTTLLFCGGLEARTILFHEMTHYQQRHSTWQLNSIPKGEYYGILDCQSFFHKWDVFSKSEGRISENYIDVEACDAAHKFFEKCIKEKGELCVDTDDVYKSQCECS